MISKNICVRLEISLSGVPQADRIPRHVRGISVRIPNPFRSGFRWDFLRISWISEIPHTTKNRVLSRLGLMTTNTNLNMLNKNRTSR